MVDRPFVKDPPSRIAGSKTVDDASTVPIIVSEDGKLYIKKVDLIDLITQVDLVTRVDLIDVVNRVLQVDEVLRAKVRPQMIRQVGGIGLTGAAPQQEYVAITLPFRSMKIKRLLITHFPGTTPYTKWDVEIFDRAQDWGVITLPVNNESTVYLNTDVTESINQCMVAEIMFNSEDTAPVTNNIYVVIRGTAGGGAVKDDFWVTIAGEEVEPPAAL